MSSSMCCTVSLTGVRAGVPLIIIYTLISMWTVHLLNALYLEYKIKRVSIDWSGPLRVLLLPCKCAMWTAAHHIHRRSDL